MPGCFIQLSLSSDILQPAMQTVRKHFSLIWQSHLWTSTLMSTPPPPSSSTYTCCDVMMKITKAPSGTALIGRPVYRQSRSLCKWGGSPLLPVKVPLNWSQLWSLRPYGKVFNGTLQCCVTAMEQLRLSLTSEPLILQIILSIIWWVFFSTMVWMFHQSWHWLTLYTVSPYGDSVDSREYCCSCVA